MHAVPASQLPGGELWRLLEGVPDPRERRGRRHRLPVILACGLAAVLAGARSFVAIGEWVAHQPAPTLSGLGVSGVGPGESTIRRTFARLDADFIDQVLGVLMWTRSHRAGRRRVIAIDGKTVRGARTPAQAAPHLVAALDHQAGTVLRQIAVAATSNEIPAVQRLLGVLDLADVVVTVDAMHTQTDTAKMITDGGGDYVFTVKANQPTLYRQLKELPWQQVPAHRATQTGHGRRTTRTIKVVDAPAWVGFPGAAQVAQVRRTTTTAAKTTAEVVYLITSADHTAAPPATLAAWIQGHWCIENRLHWVRDVSYDEDRSQVRTGHAPQVMATLRNTAISLLRLTGWTNIAAAQRHHARDPAHTLKLVLTW
nr:ISAs1 family transposase [Intrasporangium sp.]